MGRNLGALLRDSRGATAIEYGLICALIFLAAVGAVTAFGLSAIEMWDYVSNKIVGN